MGTTEAPTSEELKQAVVDAAMAWMGDGSGDGDANAAATEKLVSACQDYAAAYAFPPESI